MFSTKKVFIPLVILLLAPFLEADDITYEEVTENTKIEFSSDGITHKIKYYKFLVEGK